MACDTSKVVARETSQTTNINQQEQVKETKNMNTSMVLQKAPEFKMDAYDSATGHFKVVNSSDYKGKWLVVCFYPADFTFVCPTEIAAMNAKYNEFKELGVEILAVSTDTKFSHKIFVETETLLKDLKLTIGADPTGKVSRDFGVYIEEEGLALRGRFLINPEGVCVAQEVQAPMVGRNVNEFLRQVKAWQYATKTGNVCPAGWQPGKKDLPVSTDTEKMTGHVGDYITIEDIVS